MTQVIVTADHCCLTPDTQTTVVTSTDDIDAHTMTKVDFLLTVRDDCLNLHSDERDDGEDERHRRASGMSVLSSKL